MGEISLRPTAWLSSIAIVCYVAVCVVIILAGISIGSISTDMIILAVSIPYYASAILLGILLVHNLLLLFKQSLRKPE